MPQSTPPLYHQELTRLMLEYDHENSVDLNNYSSRIPGELTWTQQTCPKAGTVYELSGSLIWRFPDDPAERQRLLDAVGLCDVKFKMHFEAGLAPAAGQRACIKGVLQLLDTSTDPPTVRAAHHITECRKGPMRIGLPYTANADVRGVIDPTYTEVRFDGTVRLKCLEVGTEWGDVSMKSRNFNQPTFSWPGCYPGWE